MKIYERDYSVLTAIELEQWESIKQKEIIYIDGKPTMFRHSMFRDYPKAVRHYLSLFPNNYLDIEDLNNESKLNELANSYLNMLNNHNTNERTILNYIKESASYFIIASLLKGNYNFGHHSAFIFPEFMLGNSYKVDYLLIGMSSGGYQFVFVELEQPYEKITIGGGEFGETIRKGIKQVEDWEEWLDANYSSLYETFKKYKHPNMNLDSEFYKYDKTRINFAVVAGRRKDFTEKTYRLARKKKEEEKITLFHYDNLYDNAKNVIGASTY